MPGDLDTPCLVVDVDRMNANIERMTKRLSQVGVALRPHAKTHKCVEVARAQLAGGAVGITTATLSEAEVFADAGIPDIFVAYPLWAVGAKAERLRRVAAKTRLRVGADSPEGVALIGAAVNGGGARPDVMIEVDAGELRTGVTTGARAVEVATAARAAGLRVAGIFTHGGHAYQGPAAAEPAAGDELDATLTVLRALTEAGFTDLEVSAGSTPTALLSARDHVTEERPGTFVFGDRQQAMLGSVAPSTVAAFVAGTCVSREAAGRFVLDCGGKAFTKDKPALLDGYGALPAYPQARVTSMYDHHAVVEIGADGLGPGLGEVVAVVPNHICPVVNLYDQLLVMRDGAIVDRWPVAARGCSQ
ncbi:MAG TPA: alanine racemase [Nitriliruptorales bacterium]